MDGNSFFEAHQGLASWVQGFGSLLGLGIAIWVPKQIAKQSEERLAAEARRKAIAMALVVRPFFWTMKWPLIKILEQWPEGKEIPLLIDHNPDEGPAYQKEIFDMFEIPEGLAALYPKLHELDYLADIALPACAKAEDVRISLNTLEYIWHSAAVGYGSLGHETKLRQSIAECVALIESLLKAIDKMHSDHSPSSSIR